MMCMSQSTKRSPSFMPSSWGGRPRLARRLCAWLAPTSSLLAAPPPPRGFLGHRGQRLDADVLHLAIDQPRFSDVEGGDDLIVAVELEDAHGGHEAVAGAAQRV